MELESAAGGGGDRQAAVKRKKQLRAVAKLRADGSLSGEEKLLQLQVHFVAQVLRLSSPKALDASIRCCNYVRGLRVLQPKKMENSLLQDFTNWII